jgi:hypothetical protein
MGVQGDSLFLQTLKKFEKIKNFKKNATFDKIFGFIYIEI